LRILLYHIYCLINRSIKIGYFHILLCLLFGKNCISFIPPMKKILIFVCDPYLTRKKNRNITYKLHGKIIEKWKKVLKLKWEDSHWINPWVLMEMHKSIVNFFSWFTTKELEQEQLKMIRISYDSSLRKQTQFLAIEPWILYYLNLNR